MNDSTKINVSAETEVWKLQLSQSNHLIKSGALPSAFKNAEQVLAVIQYGRELNLPPMTALQNISLIQGKPTLSANLIGARLKNAGYKYKVTKYTEQEVEIVFTDLEGDKQTFSYKMTEATKAGNSRKDNYSKYSVEMLYARCLTRGGRIVAPEVLTGIYAAEEFTVEPEAPKPAQKVTAEVKPVQEKVVAPLTNEVIKPEESKADDADFKEIEREEVEYTVEVEVAIDEATDLRTLKKVWDENEKLQDNDDFKKAMNSKKDALTVDPEEEQSEEELLTKKLEAAYVEIENAQSGEDLDKIKEKYMLFKGHVQFNTAVTNKRITLRKPNK